MNWRKVSIWAYAVPAIEIIVKFSLCGYKVVVDVPRASTIIFFCADVELE